MGNAAEVEVGEDHAKRQEMRAKAQLERMCIIRFFPSNVVGQTGDG
jgi:hypothetical protein